MATATAINPEMSEIIEKLKKGGKLNESNLDKILHALSDRKSRVLAAHACSLMQEKLPKEIIAKLLGISSARNRDLTHYVLKAIRNSVRDHLQTLDDSAISWLCRNACGSDPIAAHDAMLTMRYLAEQGREFTTDHEEQIIELLQYFDDNDCDTENLTVKIIASQWVWCIIRNGHCLEEESIEAIHDATQSYDNCLPIKESCLSSLDYLAKFKKLPECVTATLQANTYLEMYHIRRQIKEYDSDLLNQLCKSLQEMVTDGSSSLSITNVILAVHKLIELKPSKLEPGQRKLVQDVISTVKDKETNHVLKELEQELFRQASVDDDTKRVFDADDSGIIFEVKQEVVATTEQVTRIRHYEMEAMFEDYEEDAAEDAKEDETIKTGREMEPDKGDGEHNWNWYRTTHSQLWKYRTRVKNNQKLAEDDVAYIADKMLNPHAWRTSVVGTIQEMEELICWLLATLAQRDVALPIAVLEKCQKYVKGKLDFVPSNKDEYNQQIITILNKFVARGEIIDKATIKEISTSYKDYSETVLLLDNIADQDDVEVVDLEGYTDKILSEDQDIRKRICHIFFCAAKRYIKGPIRNKVLSNLLHVACDDTSDDKTRCHAIAAIAEYGKNTQIDHTIPMVLCTELQKGEIIPIRVRKHMLHCLWRITNENTFDDTTVDGICELVCRVDQWDEKMHAYLLRTLLIQIQCHKQIPSCKRTEDLSRLLNINLGFDILMPISQILLDIIKIGKTLTAISLDEIVTYLLSDEPELCYTIADALVTYVSSVHVDVWKTNDKCLNTLAMIYRKHISRKLQRNSLVMLQTVCKYNATLPQSVVDVLCTSLQEQDKQTRRASSQALALYSINSQHYIGATVINEIGNNIIIEDPSVQVNLLRSLMIQAYKDIFIPDEVVSQLNLVMINSSTMAEIRSMARILLEMLEHRQHFPDELHRNLNVHSDLVYLTSDEAESNFDVISISTRLKKVVMKGNYVMSESDIARLVPQTNVSDKQSERYLTILHAMVKRHQCIPNHVLKKLQEYILKLYDTGRAGNSKIEEMIVCIAKNKQQIEYSLVEKLSLSSRLDVYEAKSTGPSVLNRIEIKDAFTNYGTNKLQVLRIFENIAGLGHVLIDLETKMIRIALKDQEKNVVIGALNIVANISIQAGTTDRYDANIIEGLNHVIQNWPDISHQATTLLNMFNHTKSKEANYLCELHILVENLVLEKSEDQLIQIIDKIIKNPMIRQMKMNKCIPLLTASSPALCSKALELVFKAVEENCCLTTEVTRNLLCLLFDESYDTEVINIFSRCKITLLPENMSQIEESFILKAMHAEVDKNYQSLSGILRNIVKANKNPREQLVHFFQTEDRINAIIEFCKKGKLTEVVDEYSRLCPKQSRPTIPIIKVIALTNLLDKRKSTVHTVQCATEVLQKVFGYYQQEISTQVIYKLVSYLKEFQTVEIATLTAQALWRAPPNNEMLHMILAMVNANTIHVVNVACKRSNIRCETLSQSFYETVLKLTASKKESIKRSALGVLLSISSKSDLPEYVIKQIQTQAQDPCNSYCTEMLLIIINHLRHVESNSSLETLVSDLLDIYHQETGSFMSKSSFGKTNKFNFLSIVLQSESLPRLHDHLMKLAKQNDDPILANLKLLKQAAGITNDNEKEEMHFQRLMTDLSTNMRTCFLDNLLFQIIQTQSGYNLKLTLADVNDILTMVKYDQVSIPVLFPEIELGIQDQLTKERWMWLLRHSWLKRNISMPSQHHYSFIESMSPRLIVQFIERVKEAKENTNLELSSTLAYYFKRYCFTKDDWEAVIKLVPEQLHEITDLNLALSEVLFLRELQKIWPDPPDKVKERISALLKIEWRVEFFVKVFQHIENRYLENDETRYQHLQTFVECLQVLLEYNVHGVKEHEERVEEIIDSDTATQCKKSSCLPKAIYGTFRLCVDSSFKSDIPDKNIDTLIDEMNESNSLNLQHTEFKVFLQEIDTYGTLLTQQDFIPVPSDPMGRKPIVRYIPLCEWGKKQIGKWVFERDSSTENAIEEVLAVLKRAIYLHKAYEPRVAQLLVFFLMKKHGYCFNEPERGLLAQARTGEGKSLIIALLAVIKALEGIHVDIVTSSTELAKRDANEWRPFYEMFNLTVSDTTREIYDGQVKDCYKANIIYSDSANFQFDVLMHEFMQQNTRGKRGFGFVIVDEVDNMLIDDGSKIAKLASPIPGMHWLHPILVAIWSLLDGLCQALPTACSANEALFGKIQTFLYENITEKLQNKVIKVPKHLQKYVDQQLTAYISNAVIARFFYRENEQYIIKKRHDGISCIQPVDYSNTGVIQPNTVWCDGLHQFLQIKHYLQVTPETLTTNYMSNLAFLRRYGSNVFGITGTVGSKASQDLLKECYNIDIAIIPSYKPKQFVELPCIISEEDRSWNESIAKDAEFQSKMQRAVLIICNTIKQAEKIIRHLERKSGIDQTLLKAYSRNDRRYEMQTIKDVIKPGEIIVATNLAGRGTDIITADDVENNGGLHVILTYMPKSLRVEEQALGRTSRQGRRGTGRVILNRAHVLRSYPTLDELNSFDKKSIEDSRDGKEQKSHISLKQELPIAKCKDELFKKFCALLKDLDVHDDQIKREALEERWGFFLKSCPTDNRLLAVEEFNSFQKKMKSLCEQPYAVINNPTYLMKKTSGLLKNKSLWNITEDRLKEALKCCEKAIDTDPLFGYQAYYTKAFLIIKEQSNDKYAQEAIQLLNTCKMNAEEIFSQMDSMRILMNSSDENVSNSELYRQLTTEFVIRDTFIKSVEKCLLDIHKTMRYVHIEFQDGDYKGFRFPNIIENEKAVEILQTQWTPNVQHVTIHFNGLEKYEDLGKRDQAIETISNFDDSGDVSITYNALQDPIILDIYNEMGQCISDDSSQRKAKPTFDVTVKDLTREHIEHLCDIVIHGEEYDCDSIYVLVNQTQRQAEYTITSDRVTLKEFNKEATMDSVDDGKGDGRNIYDIEFCDVDTEADLKCIIKYTDNQPANLVCRQLNKSTAISIIAAVDSATGNAGKCDVILKDLSHENVHNMYKRTLDLDGTPNENLYYGTSVHLCQNTRRDKEVFIKLNELKSRHDKPNNEFTSYLKGDNTELETFDLVYSNLSESQFEHVVNANDKPEVVVKANNLTANQTRDLIYHIRKSKSPSTTGVSLQLLVENLRHSELHEVCSKLEFELALAKISVCQYEPKANIITEKVIKSDYQLIDICKNELNSFPKTGRFTLKIAGVDEDVIKEIAKKRHVPVTSMISLQIDGLTTDGALALVTKNKHLTNGNDQPICDSRDFIASFTTNNRDHAIKATVEANRNRQPLKVALKPIYDMHPTIPRESFTLFISEGFMGIMDIIEKKPIPWRSCLLVSSFGTLQIAAGGAMTLFSGGLLAPWGIGLICEGAGDLATAGTVAYARGINWKAYAVRKSVSVAFTLATCGASSVEQVATLSLEQVGKEAAEELAVLALHLGSRQAYTVTQDVVRVIRKEISESGQIQ